MLGPQPVSVQSALVYDAVLLLAEVFKQFESEVQPKEMNCDENDAWESGNSIMNFMRNVSSFKMIRTHSANNFNYNCVTCLDGCSRLIGRS